MPNLTKRVEEQLQDISWLMETLPPATILREAVDAQFIYQTNLAEANRFCLVRLADDWQLESVQQLIQLFSDALSQPSGFLRFHYAQAIGELTAKHDLNLAEQATRFIRFRPSKRESEIKDYFGYFISAYLESGGSHEELASLERILRIDQPTAWVSLMFQLPMEQVSKDQFEEATRIQSLDGLRLVQRLAQAGFAMPQFKPSRSALVNYERMRPSYEREQFVDRVKSTTELMVGSLNDTAPAGLKHSTTDFLMERARLDPSKRVFNTIMHFVQLMKLDRDIASGLHARDRSIDMLPWLSQAEIDRLVIELKNSLGNSSDSHVPVIPKLLAEAMLRSPERKWNQVVDYLHELIKSGTELQSIQAIQTIYYLLHRTGSVELQAKLLLCLLSGVAHHRDELAISSITTIGQLLWLGRLAPEALKTILRKLLVAVTHRLDTSSQLAYFYHPMVRILQQTIQKHPELKDSERRPRAFFPGSFDPFSLGHEAVARAVAQLGYDVYLAIDEFSWSKRTQPNRIRREIMRKSIADELHLYEFPESISVNIARDKDLELLQRLLGNDVALIVGEDVIRGASAYRRSQKILEFPHLVFARDTESDIEEVARELGLQMARIPLSGFENVSSTLIRTSLDSEQDISQLIDPLARQFIYDYDSYRHRQLTKDALVLHEPSYQTTPVDSSFIMRDSLTDSSLQFRYSDDTIILEDCQGKCLPLVSEVLAEGCRIGYSFAETEVDIYDLDYLGFVEGRVDLRTPCSLHFDLDDLIKDDYRQKDVFLDALTETRRKLLQTICSMYPGQFVLPLFQNRVYQKLAQLITKKNDVPLQPTEPRTLGPYLAVPFGEILKKRILPNTVTKSLHTEKYFQRDLSRWKIEASPDYMSIRNQVQMIGSFDRPILLVDDLLNKGYRLNRVMPLFQEFNLPVETLYVGLISERGRGISQQYGLAVEAAYELPHLKHWFVESKYYPYLGGDSVSGEESELTPAFWPSINLIYPYAKIPFLKHLEHATRFDFSMVCLQNAIKLLEALEQAYQEETYRYPQLRHLPELSYQPRYPFHGSGVYPELAIKPSQLVRNDLENLERLR